MSEFSAGICRARAFERDICDLEYSSSLITMTKCFYGEAVKGSAAADFVLRRGVVDINQERNLRRSPIYFFALKRHYRLI